MNTEKYKFNKDILDILEIPNQIYTKLSLKQLLKEKYENNKILLSVNIKKKLNIKDDNKIYIDHLILELITNYREDLNKPLYYHYSYNKEPNYDIID
jgi:hypothetical protein